ncbi:hypothetical protein [Reichenbachiella ulvae]|uniref:Curlin associated repeat-containing protein n=1 Tax=Reichenbachiella ulvae TaxID=2980104 RepID=A0ABT3CV78_9BACT|nr:hypothetical protein [Reichenbachiella ulvae]MCV9387481.1 hypothetical protein [Reichenbachiella ulvae]
MKLYTKLTFLLVIFTLSTKAQEWNDPATTSDWNQLWKSSFVQGQDAANAPESTGWFWGINMNHSSNSTAYRYNGQIAIKNAYNQPTMYYRSTKSDGQGVWARVMSEYSTSIGLLTMTNSIRINGNNLHGDNLDFLQNTGALLVGWNRSASHGETDFISNRGTGSEGGFEFRDINNSGVEKLLLKINGDGKIGIGTSSPDHLLHIKATGWAYSVLEAGANSASILELTNPAKTWQVQNSSNNKFIIRDKTNNAARLTIDDNGNVGIGTSSPDAKLAVKGTIHTQ